MSVSSPRDWDAASYDRISDPQLQWAREQLKRLPLRGDEVVLDAGCGSGRVTALLADLVPRGRVYAVDAAPSMVAHAKGALGDRATVLSQDLVELDLPKPVDAVFSNAAFHWIHDHDALFNRCYAALKPGGRFVAQCGGQGNIDRFRRIAAEVAAEPRFARYFESWQSPWNYASDIETQPRLERAGFTDVRCWLEPRTVTPAEGRAFAETVCLVRHLDPLPEDVREPFVSEVLSHFDEPLTLEYVRLNMTASRP